MAAFTDKASLRHLGVPWAERLLRHHEGHEDVLLKFAEHVEGLNASVRALAESAPTMSKAELQGVYKTHKARGDAIWRDYIRLRGCVTPTSDTLLRLLQLSTWVVYARSMLLEKQIHSAMMNSAGLFEEWPDAIARTASDFEYVRLVGVHKAVAVSSELIGNYSPRTLMLALTAFVDAIDAVGWTPSASAYFMALFWRYALMLHAPARYAVGDAGPYALGGGDVPCRLLAPAAVKSALLEVSERLVFHHLYRVRALARLAPQAAVMQRALDLVAAREWDRWRAQVGVRAFTRALSSLMQDDMLSEDVSDRFNALTQGRYVYPGEVEQMAFTYPDETTSDASSTLFRLRLDVYQYTMKLARRSPLVHIVPYMKSVLDFATAGAGHHHDHSFKDLVYGDGTYEAYVNHVVKNQRPWESERLLLLLFEICFDIDHMANHGQALLCPHSYTDDRSVAAPGDRPPVSVGNARAALIPRDPWPVFVAVWNFYVVIRGGTEPHVFFVSPHLLDALGMWLALAHHDGHLKLDSLRAPWAECIASIPFDRASLYTDA
jgi:hypothetical protein